MSLSILRVAILNITQSGLHLLLNKYCRPIIEEEQLAISSQNQGVSLLKLHGDINHPTRLVITEDDYDTFIDKYPIRLNLIIRKIFGVLFC